MPPGVLFLNLRSFKSGALLHFFVADRNQRPLLNLIGFGRALGDIHAFDVHRKIVKVVVSFAFEA